MTRLRILFAAAPADEAEVRRRIDAALAGGELIGPDGARTQWRVAGSGADEVRPDERAHAGRLASL